MEKGRSPQEGRLTLDIADLTKEQRAAGSSLLGGSQAEFVDSVSDFQYDQIETVVFRWGDSRAQDVFANLFEHSDVLNKDTLPFVPAAVVNNQLWMLALQEKDYSPQRAFASEDDFIVVPYEEIEAEAAIYEAASFDAPRPTLLGKIGTRYAAFDLSTDLSGSDKCGDENQETKEENSPETIVDTKQVLQHLRDLIHRWDYEDLDTELNNHFALHISHWILEKFGRPNIDGQWNVLTPSYEDGVPGEYVPEILKPLISSLYNNKISLENDNSIIMRSRPEIIVTPPFIPRIDEVLEKETFDEQLEFIRSQPDIINNIGNTKKEILPQLSIAFQSGYSDWGMELLVNENGIRIAPFGREGSTIQAGDLSHELQYKSAEKAKLACQLALICAELSTNRPAVEITFDELNNLEERIGKAADIPLDMPLFEQAKPQNQQPEAGVFFLLAKHLKRYGDDPPF